MPSLFHLAVLVLSLGLGNCYVAKRSFNCGGQAYLTHDDGDIVSHSGINSGHTYGKNLDCEWRIEAPVGMHVLLTAEKFDVEDDATCQYDYLVLYDGNSTNGNTIGRYCGSTFSQVTSKGRFLTLEFITDDGTQLDGFKLHYNFTSQVVSVCSSNLFKCGNGRCVPDTYRCDEDDDCGDDSDEFNCQGQAKTCAADEFTCTNGQCIPPTWLCDGDDDCSDNSDETAQVCMAQHPNTTCGNSTIMGNQGTLSSPNYPQPYNNYEHCIWSLQGPPGTKQIAFNFLDPFNIELDTACAFDFVKVYSDGNSFNHGPFCGNISPGQFTMPGDHAFIEFRTDDSDQMPGFNLEWKALH